MTDAIENHEGTDAMKNHEDNVSIRARTIPNLSFDNDIDGS